MEKFKKHPLTEQTEKGKRTGKFDLYKKMVDGTILLFKEEAVIPGAYCKPVFEQNKDTVEGTYVVTRGKELNMDVDKFIENPFFKTKIQVANQSTLPF